MGTLCRAVRLLGCLFLAEIVLPEMLGLVADFREVISNRKDK
ncbi:hypothetical protein [Nostoc sp. UCD120]|nr:hypothetical protein [Nostoc sp. UCD120]